MKEHKRYTIGILIGGVHTYFPKEHILGIAEAAEELDVNVCFFSERRQKTFSRICLAEHIRILLTINLIQFTITV